MKQECQGQVNPLESDDKVSPVVRRLIDNDCTLAIPVT